ncbi:hypothetical protein LJK88_33350 [Paenibacillus sp. P26]|nr:hypothetical protein LJK88_33350 [Paenibacillus sp. P26]
MATVATCTGIGYDRSALQDSIRLGASLERRLEHLQMPSKVSVAVSASPLHRAGTLAKDLGIAGAPGGWEIYVGGCEGMKLRQGEAAVHGAFGGDCTGVIVRIPAVVPRRGKLRGNDRTVG